MRRNSPDQLNGRDTRIGVRFLQLSSRPLPGATTFRLKSTNNSSIKLQPCTLRMRPRAQPFHVSIDSLT